jgi:dTDP-4-amino-4,6-dideoxygalactose transaminase
VLSLPLHPGLREDEVDAVAGTVRAIFEGRVR